MVDLPWQNDTQDETEHREEETVQGRALVYCEFQDGTIVVFDDQVVIERSSRSKFADKRIPIEEIRDVVYEKRLVISYLQIAQEGVELGEASRLSTPVDENTLHFGRGKRDCAKRARDAIYDQLART
jgi:hypothetical protein